MYTRHVSEKTLFIVYNSQKARAWSDNTIFLSIAQDKKNHKGMNQKKHYEVRTQEPKTH